MSRIVIGTRGSKLALWQAGHVRERLSALCPDHEFVVEIIKTEGDARHDLSPDAFGKEGIFTAELDRALLGGSIDLAVHSLKDLPTALGPGLALAAVGERAAVEDVFIVRADLAPEGVAPADAREFISSLPAGFTVGTSSLRRIAQLKHAFPSLEFSPMRGNLDTRVRKLGDKMYDGIVVAKAGLDRLGVGLGQHLALPLSADWYLPAAGQGALGLETRDSGEAYEAARLFDHAETRAAVTAERTAMNSLGAGCRVPAGFLGAVDGDTLVVRGLVGRPEGGELVEARAEGPASDADKLGGQLAEALIGRGAARILKEVRG